MEKPSFLQRAVDEVKRINKKNAFHEELEKCTFLSDIIAETLRVTSHSIGAVRKVMTRDGWTVTIPIDDADEGKGATKYTLPYGSYVGVSHIIPHHDPERQAYACTVDMCLMHFRWGADCGVFNPDRPDLQEKCRDDLLFTAFSHGIHKCPGRNIVLMVLSSTVIMYRL